jgi:hypothetical protein
MGSCKGSRVPFKHKLVIDEQGDKLLDQGEVVVDLFARVRPVVEVAEMCMPSSIRVCTVFELSNNLLSSPN